MNESRLTKETFNYVTKITATTKWVEEKRHGEKVGINPT